MSYDNWRSQAECWGADPHLFDARGLDDEYQEPWEEYKLRTSVALTYCHDCPVTRQCRDFAEIDRQIGVWGGRVITENQRRRNAVPLEAGPELEDEGLQPCGTPAAYKRHRKRGEQACLKCRRANVDYVLAATRAKRESA